MVWGECIMKLTKKPVREQATRKSELENALKGQFNLLHSINHFQRHDVESILLEQKKLEVERLKKFYQLPKGLVKFSPSGASKCDRELFYKAIRMKQDLQTGYPYQRRWTKNSTYVHERVQADLLYSEVLVPNPSFKVHRLESGLPAWEKNIETHRVITHNGVTFVLHGMMDGVLQYKDGSYVGFEFKTKSTSAESVAKLKAPSPSHKQQCVAYSILFSHLFPEGLNEFIITYESVAKDNWMANERAVDDLKTFYVKVTDKDRAKLLDKFANITEMVTNGELPEQQTSKCMFCPYKSTCFGVEL
jgi:CRISPR/Cas system-associated exonuclease Cas4 (RecB family)